MTLRQITSLVGEIHSEWRRRLRAAQDARRPFMKTAAICSNFYHGANGFMWDEDFRDKFFSGIKAPKFKITINRAFELVAIVGPSLFWDYPERVVKPYRGLNITPEALGDPEDPNTQALYEQIMKEMNYERQKNVTRCSLMQEYLNYSQREYPNGGLKEQSQLAIVDGLVTGRGCLWIDKYSYPGSKRVLTGAEYDGVSRLLIDPDTRKPDLSDCMWIARQHYEPHWMVERRFGYAEGSLRKHKSITSDEYSLRMPDEIEDLVAPSKQYGTHDKTIWYEIWSKCGVGTRRKGANAALHQAFDKTVGDFAYVCICPDFPEFLNLPNHVLEKDPSDDQIVKALDWPTPLYRDNRWPLARLDFYNAMTGPWPLAILGEGLGELIFLNVIISALCSRIYNTSRSIVGVVKDAGDNLISKFRSGEFEEIVELNPKLGKGINELIQYLEQSQVGADVWEIVERVSEMFDKRVGLTDMLYGLQNKVSRTAQDVRSRESAVSVRPDYMASRVESWQTEVANLERICAGWHVKGDDLVELFGRSGSSLWDILISEEDPEIFVREMRATIEANSVRKPNKSRDNDNLAQISGWLLPVLQQYAAQTGDNAPLNGFIKAYGDAADMDLSGMMLAPTQPQQPQQQAPPEEDEEHELSEPPFVEQQEEGIEGGEPQEEAPQQLPPEAIMQPPPPPEGTEPMAGEFMTPPQDEIL